jgi:hypothetical protein
VANPSKYNGKLVSVTGYLDARDSLVLYASANIDPEREDPESEPIFVYLSKEDARKLGIRHHIKSGHIRVTGLFEHIDTSGKETSSKDPTGLQRAIVTGRSAFGPLGVYSNQICKITELKPLSKIGQ